MARYECVGGRLLIAILFRTLIIITNKLEQNHWIFFDEAAGVYDFIAPYLDKDLVASTHNEVLRNRVRSKTYHDMRKFLMTTHKLDKEAATVASRVAGRYHSQRWCQAVEYDPKNK